MSLASKTNTKRRHSPGRETKGKLIPPVEYNKMLEHLNLVDVHLGDVKSTLHSREFKGKASLAFDEAAKLVDYDGEMATMEVLYHLKAKSGRKRIFEIKARYAVVFEVTKDIPKEFFEQYKTLSLPLQTFPYLRECVNSLISRMGLPPLILPLRKFLVGSDS